LTSESPLKKVLKNAGILLSGNMGANIFGLLSMAIFTHSQGVDIFGYYVLFLTFIEIIDKIFNFQTWQAFIKFATDFQVKNEHHNVMMLLKYSFLIDLVSLVVATVVALALSAFAMSFFNIPQEYYHLLLLMSLTILFKTTEISTGVFRLFDSFKVQAKIAVYSSAIKLAMFGVIALIAPSFEMFIYATVVAQFITMMMKYFYAKAVLNKHNITILEILKEKVNIPLLRELKIFSFIVYKNFSVTVRMVSRQLDVVILGRLFGAEVVGIYKIAKEVGNLIAKLTDPVYQSIYPEFARLLANKKHKKAKSLALKISLYAGVVGVLFYIAFIILGEWALAIAFGSDFVSAYSITLVYLVAMLIAIISLPIVPWMDSQNLVKYTFTNQLSATIIYCIVIYPLIANYAAYGAAIAYVVYYASWSLIALNSIRINKRN
jgi:O-antigen/teichoic acid export membrane protein